MKHTELILGLSAFIFFTVGIIGWWYAYHLHKKIDRMESGRLEFDNLEDLFV